MGLYNQLIGYGHAVEVARILGRTLIVPPLYTPRVSQRF